MSNRLLGPAKKVFDPMRSEPVAPCEDLREIGSGNALPTQHYADQPYLVNTHDGGLLCVVTTGAGHEGSSGQHVLAMKSFDRGKTWQDVAPVEAPENPESSWGIPFVGPTGRVFVFYVYNADDLRELPADDPPYPGGLTNRMDSHGHYVFRWSDDHGKTWSRERVTIPVREFAIDRDNPTGGRVRIFWNVGKAFQHGGSLFLPIHKVGGLGEGWFTKSEGGLLRSDDLLQAENPAAARWQTLPDGEVGIRSPEGGGPIAEEHSFTILSDGSFFTVFRTIDGHPACSYSRDQGRSWEPSQYMRFANGRLMKHPRAATFVWKLSDGDYLYFFHNHGGKPLRKRADRRTYAYNERNPLWFCRGWEEDLPLGRVLRWSQPEIGFYNDDPMVRISYPDFIEHEGACLFSETEKSTARIHKMPAALMNAGRAHAPNDSAGPLRPEPIMEWNSSGNSREMPMPELPTFIVRSAEAPYGGVRLRRGFAIVLDLHLQKASPTIVARSVGDDGRGLHLEWTTERTLRLRLNDGQSTVSWDSDPVPAVPARHQFAINIDGGSNTVVFFRDGAIDDGGEERQFGWGRISPHYRNTCTGSHLLFPESTAATVEGLKIFPRTLTVAEISDLVPGPDVQRKSSLLGREYEDVANVLPMVSV